MSILKALRDKLSPEDYAKVVDTVGDDFNWDLVPRSRLDAVIKQRNTLRDSLAGQPQEPEEPAPTAGSEGAGKGGGQGAPKGAPQDSEATVEALKAQHQQELDALKIRYSAVEQLRAAGAIDPEVVLNAGLLDLGVAKVSKDGHTVTWPEGDRDPFAALKADAGKAFLFNNPQGGAPSGTGKDSAASGAETLQEAYTAAVKSGNTLEMVRLTGQAFSKGITLK